MDDTSPQLQDVLHRYGEQWQIQQDGGGVGTAIRRPTLTALHILVAHDLAGLAAKLNSAPG